VCAQRIGERENIQVKDKTKDEDTGEQQLQRRSSARMQEVMQVILRCTLATKMRSSNTIS
jgi:hypothetical protein